MKVRKRDQLRKVWDRRCTIAWNGPGNMIILRTRTAYSDIGRPAH